MTALDRDLILPLLYEMESAASLLGHGVTLLSAHGGFDGEPSPILANLATGAEKLLKLSIGLLALEETRKWPSMKTMKGFGHGILPMYGRTMTDLQRRLDDPETAGTAGPAIQARAREVVEDMVLVLTLRCLSEYAMEGRFHNLDSLARRNGLGPSPKERWEQLEVGILNSDTALQRTMGTPEFSTIGRPGVRRVIGTAIVGWWALYQRSWNTGVLGRTAQAWSGHLRYDVPADLGSL